MIAARRRPPSPTGKVLALDPGARWLLRSAIACGFLAAVLVVAAAFVMSATINSVFLGGGDLTAVAPLLGLLVALALVRSGFIWVGEVLAQRASSALKGTLRGALTARLLALGPAYASGERTGELVGVMTGGMDALDTYVTSFQPARALAGLVPLLVVAVALVVDPLTALVLVVTGPVLILFLALIGGRARAITEQRFLELRWMSAFFVDILRGTATLKAFGRSEEQAGNIERVSRTYGDTTMEVLRTAFQTALVLEWGGAVATALVAVQVSLRLMAGDIPFERALAILILAPEFFLPLRQLAIRFHAGAAGTAVATRMLEILAAPPGPEVPAPATATAAGAATPTAAATATPTIDRRAIAGPPAIRFADVSFAYEGGRRPALRGLDLDIPAGATVALVGETGAGKSTVANLLLRFVQAGGGTITVDGVPLEAIDVADWRGSVAWVPQAPHLFTGSVADNIRLGRPEATDAQVESAAIEAGVDGAIRSLPRGYETPLGEEGLGVSGGERQRLAIARAFLRDAPFVLLDEVTSHLDRATEAEIAGALRRLARHRTVLVISHRLKLAAAADQVVVLAGGRAVEAGTPADLLALGGAYARLVAMDAGAVESGR